MEFSREKLQPIAKATAIALTIFEIWFTSGFGILEGALQAVDFVAFIFALVFLLCPIKKYGKNEHEPVFFLFLDILLAILAVVIAIYFNFTNEDIMFRIRYVDEVTLWQSLFGIAILLLSLEAARRTTGWGLVIVSGVLLLYTFFGHYIPGSLGHEPLKLKVIIDHFFLMSEGVYGIPLTVTASTIFNFIMFGAFMEASGMTNIFMSLACLLTKNSQGGPAKVAIFASCLFGTFTGSAPANVYGTGIFTIPLMKRVGYSAPFAGAVEAVASTGGQIMPPIMGTGAFIMAELVGMPYLQIAKAALLPALLFYIALYSMIHFEAARKNIGFIPKEMIPDKGYVLHRLYYLSPIGILILFLCFGWSVTFCANMGVLSIVILSFFSKETRFTFKSFMNALEKTGKSVVMIGACCACAGIVIGAITITGIGNKFMLAVTLFAEGNLFLLLLCVMITSFVLGMGVPTAPAYIIVAALGAPAMVKLGIAPIVAHLFVFYFGVLSVITPPVCIAAFAGAAIADAKPMQTGFTAMKLGIVAFFVPFMFVYAPELLLIGDTSRVFLTIVTSVLGTVFLGAGMQGYLLTFMPIWQRIPVLFGALCLIYPGASSDLIGIVLLGIVTALQYITVHSKK